MDLKNIFSKKTEEIDLRKFIKPDQEGNSFRMIGDSLGKAYVDSSNVVYHGIGFEISLDYEAVMNAKKVSPNFAKTREVKKYDEHEVTRYHLMEFGYEPTRHCDMERESEFYYGYYATLFWNLKDTGKVYAGIGRTFEDSKSGRQYVDTETDRNERGEIRPVGHNVYEVGSCEWFVENWDEVQNGTAKTIELRKYNIPDYYKREDYGKDSYFDDRLVVSSKLMKANGITHVSALSKFVEQLEKNNVQQNNQAYQQEDGRTM